MTELLSQSYSKEMEFLKVPVEKVLIRDINDPLSFVDNNITGGINILVLRNIYSCPFI